MVEWCVVKYISAYISNGWLNAKFLYRDASGNEFPMSVQIGEVDSSDMYRLIDMINFLNSKYFKDVVNNAISTRYNPYENYYRDCVPHTWARNIFIEAFEKVKGMW